MKQFECENVRDVLPELIGQKLDARTEAAVRAHLQTCQDCQAERTTVWAVANARLESPFQLEDRIRGALRGRVQQRTRWPLAAAASIALLLAGATAVLKTIEGSRETRVPATVMERQGAGWFSVEEAFVSGAASLRDLSVEELEQLLKDLDS